MSFEYPIQDSQHAPIRGQNVSVPEDLLDPSYFPDGLNVVSRDGSLQKRPGYTELFPDLSVISALPVMEGVEFGDGYGNLHAVIFTTDKMVELIDGVWTSRTEAGNYLTGDATNPIFAYTVGGIGADNLYITNGVDKIKVWTGTGNYSDLTTTGFTTLKAKTLIGYKGHLVLGNIIDEDGSQFPYRIRWSQAGNPTVWFGQNVVSAGFVNLIEDETNSQVMRFLPIKDVLACYKENSIYNITYMGDPRYFVPRMQVADRGVISSKGVCPVGDAHLVVSEDNIYIYDGYYLNEPAIGNRIKKKFFKELTWEARGRIYCQAFPQNFEAWILYPKDGSLVCNAAYCWNWLYDSWTPHEFADTGYSLFDWIQALDTNTALYGINGNVMKLEDGTNDNGTMISAYVRTKLNEYADKAPNQVKTARRVEIQASGTSPKVQVGATNNLLTAPTFEDAQDIVIDPNGIQSASSQKSGRYLSLKVSDDTDSEPFVLAGYTIYSEIRGAR